MNFIKTNIVIILKYIFIFLGTMLLIFKKNNINDFISLLCTALFFYILISLLFPDQNYISNIADKLRKREKIGYMKKKNIIELFKVIFATIISVILFFEINFKMYQILKLEYYVNSIFYVRLRITFIVTLLLINMILFLFTLFFNFKHLKVYLKINKIINMEKEDG